MRFGEQGPTSQDIFPEGLFELYLSYSIILNAMGDFKLGCANDVVWGIRSEKIIHHFTAIYKITRGPSSLTRHSASQGGLYRFLYLFGY